MSFTLLAGGTCAATGGTGRAYEMDGVRVSNGHHYIDTSVTDFRIRPQVTLKSRPASQNASDLSWKRWVVEVTLAFPMIAASGKVEYNTYRIITQIHPELSAANELALRHEAAQVLFDSELAQLFTTGRTQF